MHERLLRLSIVIIDDTVRQACPDYHRVKYEDLANLCKLSVDIFRYCEMTGKIFAISDGCMPRR